MDRLERLLRIWHPRYRPQLALLLVIATLAGAVVYAENTLLQGLVEQLSGRAHEPGSTGAIVAALGSAATAPVIFLAIIFGAGVVRVFLSTYRDVIGSRMFIRSRNDVERAILNDLLRKGDDFYSTHATSEIVNRLEVDLFRVLDRRQNLADVWWAFLMILSNLLFFGMADVRLALVVVVVCAAGTLVTNRMSRPVKAADGTYFRGNDEVKMHFEDYLRAVPEIQVGGLFASILGRFGRPQGTRERAFVDWVLADAKMAFSRGVWPVLAFLVTVLVTLRFMESSGGGVTQKGLALIPVLIFALPGVFGNVAVLAQLKVQYELADNSIERLLEYAGKPGGPIPAGAGETRKEGFSIELHGASFQYRGEDGSLQGGVSDVSAVMNPGRWYAIVGGAGSGKSTLVNLILGRLKPLQGSVLIDGQNIASLGEERLASVASLMPQRVVVFDATIRENLYIGQSEDADRRQPTADDLAVIEGIGLGAVCRLKALEMRPAEQAGSMGMDTLGVLRREARSLAAGKGLSVAGFEDGHVDPARPSMDALAGGRTTERSTEVVCSAGGSRWLKKLASSPLGRELASRGEAVLAETGRLLDLPDHETFLEMSPEKLDQEVWALRRACREGKRARGPRDLVRVDLVQAGLTSSPREWGLAQAEADTLLASWRSRYPRDVEDLRGALAGCFEEFRTDRVHPHLTWRDNLLFGSVDFANQRQRRNLDSVLIGLMEKEPHGAFFAAQGLEFEVGRNGSRLSGGQGQLLALGRNALRRTPVFVLDEPTSALDPASRDRVAAFLRDWSRHRIVVTISHDPELTRQADEILVVGGGRLAATGTFDELAAGCEAFQRVFRTA